MGTPSCLSAGRFMTSKGWFRSEPLIASALTPGRAGGLARFRTRPQVRGGPGKENGVAGFKGTETYIASRDLEVAVNAAVALQRPLLVKGEPGTGKTVLAHEVARALGHPLIEWHIKSTTKAQQGLYEYDAVSRLRDGQDRKST